MENSWSIIDGLTGHLNTDKAGKSIIAPIIDTKMASHEEIQGSALRNSGLGRAICRHCGLDRYGRLTPIRP